MITINEQDKSVTIDSPNATMVRIDGNEHQLTNGQISIVNLPSYYDVEVFHKVEENHIERPVIEEPIIQQEPEL